MTAAVVIIGSGGMLGRAFSKELAARKIACRGVDVPEIDFARPESFDAVVQPGTSLVLNCAAFTDVDGAETREAEANVVNGAGVGALAARCKAAGALLVHYSTDYVFEGVASAPYIVDHPRAPLNAYGRSKAIGEERLEQSGARYLLLRTSWLYAPWGKNFVLTMRSLMSTRDEVRVVNDQVGRPTSAQYLAERTLGLADVGATGTFHVTDGGQCSWHEFASAIATHIGSRCRVLPCSSAEFPRPAQRPAYSVLDLSTTEQLIGPSRDWHENVNAVLDEVAAAER